MSPGVQVTINIPDIELGGRKIEEFRNSMKRAFNYATRGAVRASERRLRDLTPVSGRPWERAPGGLRANMFVSHSRSTMTATWRQRYAEYIDKGTPAHVVLPKPGKLLKWQPGPGVWGKSAGHMVRGIQAHGLTGQAQQVMREELEFALLTLILAEIGGIG